MKKNNFKKMSFFFDNFFHCIDKKNKGKFYKVTLLNFFNALLEFLTIAIIIPIIVLLLNKNLETDIPGISLITSKLNEYSFNEQIFFLLLSINIIFFLRFLFLYLINKYKIEFLNKLFSNISTRVFITNMLSKYEKLILLTTPGIVKNIYFESELFVKNIATSFVSLSSEIFKILAILSILIFVNPYAVFFGILFFGSFSVVFLILQKPRISKWGQMQIQSYEKMIQFINEGFSSIREIKLIKNKTFFSDKFRFYVDNFISAKIKKEILNSLPRPLFEFIFILLISLIVVFYVLTSKDLNELAILLGIFGIGFVRLLPSVMKMVNDFQNIFYSYKVVQTIKDKINDYYSIKSNIEETKNYDSLHQINNLSLKNISYKYPNTDNRVIKNFSYNFQKGKIYGIFGESGSGKTTLISILMGLLKPTEGDFLVNNKKVDLENSNFFNKITYVPQKILLLNDTIKVNIALGHKESEIDNEKLKNAIDMSNLSNFINHKDETGYILSEAGKNISEGQKQRIGFARAIYSDREIVFLDEFTSSLDLNNENLLVKNVTSLKKDRIIFIISHKKKIIETCDEVIFMDDIK